MRDYEYDITVEQVLDKVIELAEANPEYVYERPYISEDFREMCSYLTGADGKGCIVGQALSALGVSKEHLALVEGFDARGALVFFGVDVSSTSKWRASRKLDWIQGRQDDGVPWGEAVELGLRDV